MADSGEMLDEVRSQVFDDRVYVFTPKGDVVDLPAGSTPLDFAYHIHSDVGHRCIGAKIGGRIVPFTYQLQMGDQIEIITQKQPNPSRDWLNRTWATSPPAAGAPKFTPGSASRIVTRISLPVARSLTTSWSISGSA
jgi:GTP pyrophosphokinase